MRLSRFVAGLVSLGWLVVSPTAARGLTVHALDAADVGAWLDGTMSYGVQAGDVAGAVVGWLSLLQALDADISLLNASVDPWLRSVQLLALAAGPGGAILAAANTVEVWRDGGRGWWAKASALVLALAFLDLAWIAFALKLITASPRF